MTLQVKVFAVTYNTVLCERQPMRALCALDVSKSRRGRQVHFQSLAQKGFMSCHMCTNLLLFNAQWLTFYAQLSPCCRLSLITGREWIWRSGFWLVSSLFLHSHFISGLCGYAWITSEGPDSEDKVPSASREMARGFQGGKERCGYLPVMN